jgi:hypothetical protein
VVTGFVGQGLFRYYQATGSSRAQNVLRSACDFLLHDLERTETDSGLCFSYTPVLKDCCFNASMLGAELLSMCYAISGDRGMKTMAQAAVDFTLAYQKVDGSWNYSVNPSTGIERKQIDFHQGFVLNSLYSFIDYTDCNDEKYVNSLLKGADYYRRVQFFETGRSKWRIPKVWPVEIHNQSQGIITFARLSAVKPEYIDFARRVLLWTCNNMQDDDGFFYYRKYRIMTNKISFMRWSQAWMFLALCTLLETERNGE